MPNSRRRALLLTGWIAANGLALLCHSRVGTWLGLPAGNLLGTSGLLIVLANLWALDAFCGKRVLGRVAEGALARIPRSVPERPYWVVFATLLATGLAYRLWLTYLLGVPTCRPDSVSYLVPALVNPPLPFSEARTAGLPLLCSFAMNGLGHPVGILVVHNLLWLGSSTLIVIGVRVGLGEKAVSLALLAYLCTVQKNLALEYMLLSEHMARALYGVFFALVLLSWRRTSKVLTALLALTVFANVLVKPTALILVPVALLGAFARHRLDPPPRLRAHAAHALAFAGLVGALLISYCALYQQRYGEFATNSFLNTALYSQVGHLTDLDSEGYPELKRQLKTILPHYASDYAAQGDHRPNWLVFGTTDESLRADFGDLSPSRFVEEEITRRPAPGKTLQQRREAIYKHLARGAIAAHPGEYLTLAASEFWRLYRTGLGGWYAQSSRVLTISYADPVALAEHGASAARHFREAFALAGLPAPGPYGGAAYHDDAWKPAPFLALASAYTAVCHAASTLTDLAISIAPILLVLLPFPLRREPFRAANRDVLVIVLLLGATLLAYGVLLALICVSETPRFAANVQDCFVLGGLLLAAIEARAYLAWAGHWATPGAEVEQEELDAPEPPGPDRPLDAMPEA